MANKPALHTLNSPGAVPSARFFSKDSLSMGMKLRGLDSTLRRLAELKREMPEAAHEEIKETAEDIAEGAIKRAPVDTGNLEESIYAQQESPSRFRIIVDPETDGTRYGKDHESDYHVQMHEGTYNLGEKSLTKQRGQRERVGRHYLRRAFDHAKRNVDKRIKARLKAVAFRVAAKARNDKDE